LAASSQRRSYAGIAKSLEIDYHYIYDHIKSIDESTDFFIALFIDKVKKYRTRSNKGYIIFDFTRLAKSKDAQTPMTTWDRDARINKVNNGFSLGFCVWTDGKITIPLTHCFWLNKTDAGESYATKKERAQSVLRAVKQKLDITEVIIDGEFATHAMMDFFSDEGIDFTARIPANRNVIIGTGKGIQLKNHPALRLRKNEKSRTIFASYGGRLYNFTAVKQMTRGGKKKIVFIISTNTRTSKEHVRIYKLRWLIEKFFRTAKQSLGLEDCQAQRIDRIINHIHAVMLAFIALEETKVAKKKKSVEAILSIINSKNRPPSFLHYADLVETYAAF
jgi:hypothetical protein